MRLLFTTEEMSQTLKKRRAGDQELQALRQESATSHQLLQEGKRTMAEERQKRVAAEQRGNALNQMIANERATAQRFVEQLR